MGFKCKWRLQHAMENSCIGFCTICITKKQKKSGLEKGCAGMDLCLLGFFGNTSNTEQFMEYMECSIRFFLLFLIRAVVDHTCEWGIIKSCLKRDKCLSQPNQTLHFLWVPQWELGSWASCRIRCSWKNCCDGMLQQFSFCKMRSCVPVLMLLWALS